MCDWMPSLEEQDIAEKYVLKRPLERPVTSYKRALIWTVSYIVFNIFFSAVSYLILQRLGIFSHLPVLILNFKSVHPALFIFIYTLLVFLITGLIMCRMAVVGVIRLYQHYADEDVRRRCLFMPTCSEYAVLAVKKYGVIIGLIKTANRLFRKCRGNIYRIDYP